ncbi:host attachment protein [Caulobacter sp.]|uniref:host attachment protein n=1 Tax=Caulobacter sp. TaxID=78 RepID=UPI003BAF496B
MIPDASTLVVVADGHRARLLEQARLDGPLHDRPEWLAGLKERHPHSSGPVPHEGDPHDRAERAFVKDLAHKLEEVAHAHSFDQLILVAPPRALGHLREALSKGLAAKVVGSDPHERVDATIMTLTDVVHAIRNHTTA